MRCTLCVEQDQPEEMLMAARWFKSWLDELSYVSTNRGCDCCVHLFDVEGTEAAISALPKEIACSSDWAQGRGEAPSMERMQNPFRSSLKAKDRRDAEQRTSGRRRR
jgi:hypothetical protein